MYSSMWQFMWQFGISSTDLSNPSDAQITMSVLLQLSFDVCKPELPKYVHKEVQQYVLWGALQG